MAFWLMATVAVVGWLWVGCSDDRRDMDVGGDLDVDTDTDGDTDTGPTGPIPQDCDDCVGVGYTLENMLCAFDICDENLVDSTDYTSPTAAPTETTWAAVNHFGSTSNDLSPQLNDSYALMASGPCEGTEHSEWMGQTSGTDPFSNDGFPTYDEMEWSINLQAPAEAHGFGFKYVFFSEEYDDWVGTPYNDKFYVFLEAGSTNNGEKTILNYTACRNPSEYFDFECTDGMIGCEVGEYYCYIAINTSTSDCCWYNGCTDGYSWDVGADITGTGYECPADQMSDGPHAGSSTGWLQTTWPIDPNETFNITFHIHDCSDGIYDSEVILDSFQFMYDSTVPETVEVE
jgi:hypothetical protein